MQYLKKIIDECIRRALYEGTYDKTTYAHNSKVHDMITMGKNPLTVDVGGHNVNDRLQQASTFDIPFEPENLFVSDNKFMIYKIKNFGNDKINDSMAFFGNTVEFRRALDTVRGAADRGGKGIYFRTISPESEKTKVERSKFMVKTFWEFSFDGEEWYILKPNPVQSLKISKFKGKQ